MINKKSNLIKAKESCQETEKYGKRAYKYLKKASHWGLADMIGGKGWTSFFKRRKMSKAERSMKKLDQSLARLDKDLRRVGITPPREVSSLRHGFLSKVIDIFFDNLLVDSLNQTDIGKSKKEVKKLLKDLDKIEREIDDRLKAL